MSFEKVDLRASRDVDLENAKLAETLAEDLKFNANWCSEALAQAYAEIDRLTAENADLRDKLKRAVREDDYQGKQDELVWKCPASIPDGEYNWSGSFFGVVGENINFNLGTPNSFVPVYRDWTDPPKCGVWRVVEPGKAVWVRE